MATTKRKVNSEGAPKPPAYEPTHCSKCPTVIVLSEDAYSIRPGTGRREYWCEECTSEVMKRSVRRSEGSD